MKARTLKLFWGIIQLAKYQPLAVTIKGRTTQSGEKYAELLIRVEL